MISLPRRLSAEAIGSAFLLCIVIGSGIMAERLSGGNIAIALLANTLATGTGLIVIILIFAPVSGAHFNPVVSIAKAWQGQLSWKVVPGYVLAQVIGAFVGVAAAHVMFNLPLFSASLHARSGYSQGFSEFVATFGLLATIIACDKQRPTITPFAVGAYIMSAYWFTASTSFANPVVTLARSVSNTFAGIRPEDTIGFIVAQLTGMLVAIILFRWLLRSTSTVTINARDL